jgi:hypothetical protein
VGKGAWKDFNPPDDGTWADLKPGEPGYDYAYASDTADVALMDRPPPDDDGIPRLSLTFGSQLGWSRQREGGTIDLSMTAPDGAPCLVAVCGECGSGFTADTLPGSAVCGGCYRAGDPGIEARIASMRTRAN